MDTKAVSRDRHASIQAPDPQLPACDDSTREQLPTEAPVGTVMPNASMFFVVERPAQEIPALDVAPLPSRISPEPVAAPVIGTSRSAIRQAAVIVIAFVTGAVLMGVVASGPSSPIDNLNVAASGAPERGAGASADSTDAVQDVILQYRKAVSSEDTGGLAEVWPTVDSRTIDQMFSARVINAVDFERCDIIVSGAGAEASCAGRLRYTDEEELPHVEPRRWNFTLRQARQRWLIQSVVSTYSVEAALSSGTP